VLDPRPAPLQFAARIRLIWRARLFAVRVRASWNGSCGVWTWDCWARDS